MEETTQKHDEQPWRARFNFNTFVALGLILFSVTAFLLIPYQIEQPKLFMGRSMSSLSPSLFPRLAIIGLFILSAFYLFYSSRMTEKNLFKEIGAKGLTRILVTLAVFTAYALLFETLGFVLSSALVVGSLTVYYGNRNIFIILGVMSGAPLIIYYIFTHALQVSLPSGLLF